MLPLHGKRPSDLNLKRGVVAALGQLVLFLTSLAYGQDPAVQTPHQERVPHIDRQGRILHRYDPEKSFFMLASWGVPESRIYKGIDYRWHHLVDAGYNCVWPWPMGGYTTDRQLSQAREHGLQVVLMRRPSGEALTAIADHPNLMGIVWQDEPLINYPLEQQGQQVEEFKAFRSEVKSIAPDLPVFVNTASWMIGNGREHWIRWHKESDVSCHDNYVIWPKTRSLNLGSYGTEKNGIADSVSLAARLSEGRKPVWLVVGAFETEHPASVQFPFRYPTPDQLRSMVYTGLIHGATGVVYYAWDSNVTRFGIAPQQQPEIPGRPTATPIQALQAEVLWKTVAQLNRELRQLAPVLLSPTISDVEYSVRFEGESITETPIRTLLKPLSKDEWVLLMVNMDDAVLNATLEFDRIIESAEWMFEGSPVLKREEVGSSFEVLFEPFTTRVLRLQPGGGE
ncbi:MAG: hypothetical protein VXY07_05425 [Planctomycetota bacterium]|nr:hypothetical protein [Planctomycetota bacterium]